MKIQSIFLLCFVSTALLAKADSNKIPYPFNYCVVSGEKFGGIMGKPVAIIYKNHEIRFCCKGCIANFYAEPEFFLKRIVEVAHESNSVK